MTRHILLLFYRNFKKFKSTSIINLVGLSTGLACTLFIYLWVVDELQVDKFHEKDQRLYQVLENIPYSDGIITEKMLAGLLAESLAEEMPEIEYAVASGLDHENVKTTLSANDHSIKGKMDFVSKDFFNLFSYELLQGEANQVLADKSGLVLSESMARKLFNTTEGVLGKPVTATFNDKQYLVTGIFKDLPQQSTYQADFLLSYDVFKDVDWVPKWNNRGPQTYLSLKEGTDPEQFNAKIEHFLSTKVKGSKNTLFIRPYSDGYLYGKYENGQQAGGRIEYVKLFSIIAAFILAIACINFMNLSTAKASRRLKEVGVKKAMGAHRKTLISQYLAESVLMTFASLFIALLMVELLLPHFNAVTGKQLTFVLHTHLILYALGITLLTGLIAGSYPALYLSGFNPVSILKGKLKSTTGELWVRKGLVVFQFSLSVLLIVAVMVVYKQINFIQSKNLGTAKENIIHFDSEGKIKENLETFVAEVKKIPGVANASGISEVLVASQSATDGVQWPGKEKGTSIKFSRSEVYYGMLEMLGIEMAAGRTFSKDMGTDGEGLIFNETAVQVMGLQHPVGTTVNLWGKDMKIIGVSKDFHFKSLHEKVEPMLFRMEPEHINKIMVSIEAGREKETLQKLQAFYQAFNPGFPFEYTFNDEDYQALYVAEQRVAVLSRYFAGMAILISCLGLYGLAGFAAEQHAKEIGIRKVLGATVPSLLGLLSTDFIKLVFISIVMGSLVSWIALSRWLDGFAYRIELSWLEFGVAGAAALCIAICTISYQALKAATASPVKNLKAE